MSVKKITKTVYLCTCELPDCRKSWESEGDSPPERCRWCGRRTWNRENKREKFITAFGKTQNLKDWAKETGIGPRTIGHRIKVGWTDEEAVSIPPGEGR